MPRANGSSKYFACWLLTFVLTVLGAHLWLVWLYGSALPFWDQWGEARSFFKPWMEGHLTWLDVAANDGDHRIIPTHLLDLALIWLNGRWDPLLQMTVNAFLHTAYAGGLAFCLWHFGERPPGWLVCGLLLPFFTLPFAGENAIWGVNSLWYFINIFGLATVVGLGFFRAGSWPWWLGLAAALLGLVTMSLGPVAPMALAGLPVLRTIKQRRFGRKNLIALAVCLLLVAIGVAMGVRQGGYRPLQAHSVAEFTAALIRHLDWPFYQWRAMAGVIVLPLVVLLGCYLRPDFQAARAAELLLTLAFWSILQSAVLAFGRANYGDLIPASRYTEVFAILLIASLFATVLLGEHWQRDLPLNRSADIPVRSRAHDDPMPTKMFAHLRPPQRADRNVRAPMTRKGPWLPVIYAGVIFWGLLQMSNLVVDNLLVPTRLRNLIAEERIATWMATGKDPDLLEQPTIGPDPQEALLVLRDPSLRPILPVACVSPAPTTAAGWLTTASRCLLRHGTDLTAAGLALFVGLCGFGLARGALELNVRQPEGLLALFAGLAVFGWVCSKHSWQRQPVECGLQQQLAGHFQASGNPTRAAFHAHQAEKLKPGK